VSAQIQRVDNELRVTGQVVDASGKSAGAIKATGGDRELFAIEDAVAHQVVAALAASSPNAVAAAPATQPVHVEMPFAPTRFGNFEGSDLQQSMHGGSTGVSPQHQYTTYTQPVYPSYPTYPITYGINGYNNYSDPYGYNNYGYGYNWGWGYPGSVIIIGGNNGHSGDGGHHHDHGGNWNGNGNWNGSGNSSGGGNGQAIRAASGFGGRTPPPGIVNTVTPGAPGTINTVSPAAPGTANIGGGAMHGGRK
jgi:hypothetical protein